MNKKISQFPITTKFNDHDLLTLVQNNENRNMSGDILYTNLAIRFATNDKFDGLKDAVSDLDEKIYDNYQDLYNKIIIGDKTVTKNLTNTLNEYYNVLLAGINALEDKHDIDLSEIKVTIQGWIDAIGNSPSKDQLLQLINRITILENIVNELAEEITSGGGGGGGGIPSYHTQGTNTILPLTGYYYTGDGAALKATDTLNQALAKLEAQIRNSEGGGGSGGHYLIKVGDNTQATDDNAYSALRSDRNYISKTTDDTAKGYVKFLKGIQGGDVFREGFGGEGASLWPTNGKWKLEVDEIFVRGGLTVNELIVNQIKSTGGEILVTIADLEITRVEPDAQGDYICYFDNEGGTKYNQFQAGDQAICQIFDGQNVKRYWRLVKEVGADFIILSETICEPGSATPEAGDVVLQLGNRYPNGANRRSAIFISGKGPDGPAISMYDNIDDFNLVGKDRTSIGKNSKFIGTIYQSSSNGDIVRVPADKGEYMPGSTYYYYDRVSHNGSLWLCIATETDNPPAVDNEEWLLQVSKGDAGASGSDKAKWVEIIGDRLFMYDNPRFEGAADPLQLVLVCNTYNLENPTYEWTLKGGSEILSTTVNFNVQPSHFGDKRNLYLRCTVRDGEDTFYDEVQLAKLGDGSEGADAYYIDLTNGTVSIPYDSSGNNPSISLDTISTEVFAYKGINRIDIENLTASVTSGTGQVVVMGNKVTLASISSPNIVVTITVQIDNVLFKKAWYINKIYDGDNGFDGIDAAYVMLTGEQLFKYPGDGTVSPNQITLYASAYNLTNPVYRWYWSVAGNNEWNELSEETNPTITIHPNGTYFRNSVEEVSFKVIAIPQNSSVEYFDIITINKLRNGKDGTSPYRGVLSNESHTLAASYNGTVTSEELMKATTNYSLYSGTTKLNTSEFSIKYVNVDNNIQNTLSHDEASQSLTVSALHEYVNSTIWKVQFCVPANSNTVVDVVDFSVAKAKGGAPGDYEIIIYCGSNQAQPATPTLTTRPPANGSYNQGNYWYPSIPSLTTTAVWMSSALFDGLTGQRKIGESWSTPIRMSGLDGSKGDTGEPGAPGSQGPAGPSGPALNYRGEYNSSLYYYKDATLRDVVTRKVGNVTVYYAANRASITPGWSDGDWERLNSFQNIATGLLFAEKATISNWTFDNWYIYSNSLSTVLNGADNPNIPVFATGILGGVDSRGLIPDTSSPGGYKVNTNAALQIYNKGYLTVGEGSVSSNAGISGIGTATTNPVRFWAGNTFAKKDEAPFQVLNDGSLYASKINATGGTIGGYVISETGLKKGGMTLSGGLISFQKGNIRAAIGETAIAPETGMVVPVWVENHTPNPNLKNLTSYFSAKNANVNIAIHSVGNITVDGSVNEYKHFQFTPNDDERGNVLPVWQGNTFLIYGTSTTNREVYLPDKEYIKTALGLGIASTAHYRFRVTIIASNWGIDMYNVMPSPGMTLFDADGSQISAYKLYKNMARDFIIYKTDTFYAYALH